MLSQLSQTCHTHHISVTWFFKGLHACILSLHWYELLLLLLFPIYYLFQFSFSMLPGGSLFPRYLPLLLCFIASAGKHTPEYNWTASKKALPFQFAISIKWLISDWEIFKQLSKKHNLICLKAPSHSVITLTLYNSTNSVSITIHKIPSCLLLYSLMKPLWWFAEDMQIISSKTCM